MNHPPTFPYAHVFRQVGGGLLFIIATWMISGCQSSSVESFPQPLSRDALPNHLKGAYDAKIIKLITALHKKDVKVIATGQVYLISIPANLLFPPQSPRLTWTSYDTLNTIVVLLRQFRKVALTLTVYSPRYVPYGVELNRARAAAVAEYLWSQGIDSRLLIVQGEHGKGGTARVEMVFREALM